MNNSRTTRRYGRRSRAAAIAAATSGAVVLIPTAAQAHGLGEVTDRSIGGFIPLGIEHMLLGWDHLLFIAGVVMIATSWRLAVKLISVFVLGHSTTLIAATLAGWQVNASVVDVIIGLSVVVVGIVAVRGRPEKWVLFGVVVFAFGLVHGLGLSTRLQEVGLPDNGLLIRVIAFNAGIEIGQLAVIAIIAALVAATKHFWPTALESNSTRLIPLGGVALLAGGALAMSLVAAQSTSQDKDPARTTAAALPGAANCSEGPRTEKFPATGGHASKPFYEPTETTPLGDFGHSLADGYVAILYQPDLPADQVTKIRTMVTAASDSGLLGGPITDQEAPIKAVNAWNTLTCKTFDADAIEKFSAAWWATFK